MFRVLQEALTNVSRHARATSVEVSLLLHGNELLLIVADNGVGITPRDQDKPTAFGLKGMAERVRALNGSMTLGTSAGGTQLTVRIPAFRNLEQRARAASEGA
jgi:signal transduction histidine kinase